MKYVEPLNSAAYPEREGKYITANPVTGLMGSTVPGESIEHSMREIVHVIEMAGLVPSPADLTQLYQAIMLLYPEVEGFLPLAGGTMKGSILAETDNTISIGSALKRLKEIFAVRFRGIADSADKLQTPRKINNINFDGTENIDVPPHTALLLNNPGYIKLYGSGLIIQWGTCKGATVFPIAFPHACLTAQFTVTSGMYGDESVADYAYSVQNLTKTGLTGGSSSWFTGRYLAIGY